MKFTIIRPDGLVAIDGLFLPVDLSLTSNKLRVVQWDTDHGHEEWADRDNTELLSLDSYQHILNAWYAEKATVDAKAADPYYGMTKEQIQLAMDVKIVAEEDKRSYLPFPHTDGHTYKVSAAIQNTRMRLEGADPTSPMDWDDVNGVTVHMTVGEFVAMANAVYDRGAANYAVAKSHKAEMRKLDKPQEYDFSDGWY